MVIKYALIILSTAFLLGTAGAQSQDAPKTKPQIQEQTTLKTEPPKMDTKTNSVKKGTPKDLDKFFKEGAEQAKEGSTCHKPSLPVA